MIENSKMLEPKLEGTVAARLAAMRADAWFVLWSLQFCEDEREMWQRCDRADWLVDAVALSGEYLPRSNLHSRVVHALMVAAQEAVRREGIFELEVFLAIETVFAWVRGTSDTGRVQRVANQLAVKMGGSMSTLAGTAWSGTQNERNAMHSFGAIAAVFFAAATVLDPRAAATSAMSASLVIGGALECAEMSDFIRWLLPIPTELARHHQDGGAV